MVRKQFTKFYQNYSQSKCVWVKFIIDWKYILQRCVWRVVFYNPERCYIYIIACSVYQVYRCEGDYHEKLDSSCGKYEQEHCHDANELMQTCSWMPFLCKSVRECLFLCKPVRGCSFYTNLFVDDVLCKPVRWYRFYTNLFMDAIFLFSAKTTSKRLVISQLVDTVLWLSRIIYLY